jgi:HK97 family phage prohead protease
LDFKIYTNALKAYESENGERYVTGTTSSTIRDLHGDEMSLDALKTMAETARQNMTVFLNHNYNVPEDLFGSATDAQIVRRYDSETNEEVYDLDLNIRVVNEDENPEALRAYRAIKRGVKLGLSIGARVEKARRKAAEGDRPESILIEKVRLLEASVVGIPANQRSYLQNAVKSLRSGSVDIDELEGVIEEEKSETEVTSKAEAGSVIAGDWVLWSNEDGETMCGAVEYVMTEGTLGAEGSEYSIEATPEDPAALVRIYEGEEGNWEATEMLVGQKVSALTKINPLPMAEEDEETEMSETEKDLFAGEVVETAAGDETIDLEKKTRVTVTVSTDSEEKQPAAASVAPSAPDAAAADSEEKLDEIKASAEDVADGEVTEKVEDEKEVVEEEPVDANVEALQELGAELVTGDAEKSIADESSVQPEVAEAVVISVETEASSFEEVESIAKSALDAANAAQEEVTALAAKVTELLESKAKVEEDLAKALDLIDRISDLGIGRKFVDRNSQKVNVKAAERAPWLSPYVQRVLEAQDEE